MPGAVWIRPDDWITPSRSAWIDSITRIIFAQPGPVVIAAHRLGGIATAHLPPRVVKRIHGGLLVAPGDPECREVLADITPVPYAPLPSLRILGASSKDLYCPSRLASA